MNADQSDLSDALAFC